MKHFWALPVALRLVVAAQHPFSVQNDLLAFPQYEVVYSESFVSSDEAEHRFASPQAKHASSNGATSSDLAPGFQPSGSQQDAGETEQDTFERMILNGQQYMCRIPYIPPDVPDNNTASATSQAEQQQELIRASNHGWELLSGMQGQCLYHSTGWWVYSFCYNAGINQFHPLPPGRGVPIYPPTPDPNVHNFLLGKFPQADKQDKSVSKDDADDVNSGRPSGVDLSSELQTRGETNFLVQKLGGGTTCDLTGEERRIEVQFHCNPGSPDRISMIKETASCVYLMVIHTPRLCNDVAFLPPQIDKPNAISCQEIVSKADETRWKQLKTAKAKHELFGQEQNHKQESSEPPPRPIIGGIELGGHKLVGGSPERTIKVSNIAKPPKPQSQEEKYIATLAESDGKYTKVMSEREIRKYDFKGTLEDIEDFIVKTETWAEGIREGQPWRLDVVQTPDGMQFRGILMNDEDQEEPPSQANEGGDKRENQEGSQEEYKQS